MLKHLPEIVLMVTCTACAIATLRMRAVHRFRVKLMMEESSWLQIRNAEIFTRARLAYANKNVEEYNRLRNKITLEFRRYRSLPPYDTMLWRFWVPLKSYAKSLDGYYGEI